jgi:hypothetical protein
MLFADLVHSPAGYICFLLFLLLLFFAVFDDIFFPSESPKQRQAGFVASLGTIFLGVCLFLCFRSGSDDTPVSSIPPAPATQPSPVFNQGPFPPPSAADHKNRDEPRIRSQLPRQRSGRGADLDRINREREAKVAEVRTRRGEEKAERARRDAERQRQAKIDADRDLILRCCKAKDFVVNSKTLQWHDAVDGAHPDGSHRGEVYSMTYSFKVVDIATNKYIMREIHRYFLVKDGTVIAHEKNSDGYANLKTIKTYP